VVKDCMCRVSILSRPRTWQHYHLESCNLQGNPTMPVLLRTKTDVIDVLCKLPLQQRLCYGGLVSALGQSVWVL
jgi:hypothetical protein